MRVGEVKDGLEVGSIENLLMVPSDVTAWLGLEAMALAWLLRGWA